MTSIQQARAACSPNLEKKCDVGGLATLLWCGWDYTGWSEVLVTGQKGKDQSLLRTSFPPGPVRWLIHCSSWLDTMPSCSLPPSLTHTRAEWGQKRARLKPLHGNKPRGSKTCSSFLQQQQQPSVTPRPRGGKLVSPLEDHIFIPCLRIQVPWWLLVLSLADYCRVHFLHVSFGFVLISCPYFTLR